MDSRSLVKYSKNMLLQSGLICYAGLKSQLLTPGTMAPYSGGGQRARGWGYVREPAHGFFIGGSSIKEMNGVYKRVSTVPGELLNDSRVPESFQLVYRKWPGYELNLETQMDLLVSPLYRDFGSGCSR